MSRDLYVSFDLIHVSIFVADFREEWSFLSPPKIREQPPKKPIDNGVEVAQA